MQHINYSCLLFLLLFASCSVHTIGEGPQKKRYKNIKSYFKDSDILKDHLTGLVVYNLDEKEYVFNQNGDLFFTPAS